MFGEKNRVVDITTLIGKTCKITGNIITRESIRVDGHVVGNIQTDNVCSITETAMLDGDVRGAEIFVSGKIKGNLIATKSVELEKTAVIVGDIITAKLLVHFGASFNGNTKMGDNIKNADEKKTPNSKPEPAEDK